MCLDVSLNGLDLYSKSQLYEKAKSSVLMFSQISQSIWIIFGMLPQSVVLLRLMLDFFQMINIQGRELCPGNFPSYKCNVMEKNRTCIVW